jgi:hypothetical protein
MPKRVQAAVSYRWAVQRAPSAALSLDETSGRAATAGHALPAAKADAAGVFEERIAAGLCIQRYAHCPHRQASRKQHDAMADGDKCHAVPPPIACHTRAQQQRAASQETWEGEEAHGATRVH